ncbi:MAG: MgtC/SapB family protein [Armatimonadota bacterium]|nr:MgtC/SapB family protein [Armatimonadota bacterium]MDR7519454.1 MgtC/SapB family protein [Armatimonadota bacterium]MDR7550258.1 MgtC/SapB family protein [Armatimonadota bacterium]
MIPWWEILLRLALALLLGGLVGWERESVEKPAGFRTHILVCVGAALFALVSLEGFFGSGADPSRVASNIVVGIGFLGAGTIWRTGGGVQGLTTAASLWTVAAVGTAIGIGFYAAALGATAIVIGVLTLMKGLERRLPRRGMGHCVVLMADVPGQLGKIGTTLGALGVNIDRVEFTQKIDQKVLMDLTLRLPLRVTRDDVLVALGEIEGVDECHWES